MSNSSYREPTNDELWAQPPAAPQPAPAHQELAPLPPMAAPVPVHQAPPPVPYGHSDRTTFALAIVSIVLAIPLTAISLSEAGLRGLLVVWVGIVLVNIVYARSRRH
jgi:hypothetical protein